MKINRKRQGIIFIIMAGFMLGILYANFIAKKYVTVTDIFQEDYLKQYIEMKTTGEEYTLYLLRYRMLPLICMGILAMSRYKMVTAILTLIWTGFRVGVLAVTSVLTFGVSGMLVCLIAILPHFVFYLFAYLIVIWFCLDSHRVKWNYKKTVVVLLIMTIGIMVESNLNPWMMKVIINLLLS